MKIIFFVFFFTILFLKTSSQSVYHKSDDWLSYGFGLDRFFNNHWYWLSGGADLNVKVNEKSFMQASYYGNPLTNLISHSNYSFNAIAVSLGKSRQRSSLKWGTFVGIAGVWGREEKASEKTDKFFAVGLHGNFQFILLTNKLTGVGLSLFLNINYHNQLVGIKLVNYLSDNVSATY